MQTVVYKMPNTTHPRGESVETPAQNQSFCREANSPISADFALELWTKSECQVVESETEFLFISSSRT